MATFSRESVARLQSCHQDLQSLFFEAIKYDFDFAVLWGYRGEADQNKFYEQGNSTKKYPDSKHNKTPSLAVDVAPYPIDWNDETRFILLAGRILLLAEQMKIKVRWGGFWKHPRDLGHYELVV